MSAIKDKIAWYEFLVETNREKGIVDASLERDLAVTIEVNARLDALEAKAHEHHYDVLHNHITPDGVRYLSPSDKPDPLLSAKHDTERSCLKCRSYNGCQATAEELGSALPEKGCMDYSPKAEQPAQEQLWICPKAKECNCSQHVHGLPACSHVVPHKKSRLCESASSACPECIPYAQEQGGEVDWKAQYDLLAAKYRAVVEHLDKQEGTPCEQIRHEHEIADLRARLEQAEAKVNELTAELEKQKASAFETGELALKRGFEIERLEKEQGDILFLVQTRLQPPGSPCPGGPVMLVTWITGEAVKKIERLEKENAELKRIAGIAIENWSSWVHDQLDGTSSLEDAIAEVNELKRQLDKSEVTK